MFPEHNPELENHPRANQIFWLAQEDADAARAGFIYVDPVIIAAVAAELRQNNALFREFENMGELMRRDREEAREDGRRIEYVALDVVPPREDMPRNERRVYAVPEAFEVSSRGHSPFARVLTKPFVPR